MGYDLARRQVRYPFSKVDRISATSQFRAIIHGGQKVSSKGLSLFVCRRKAPGQRLGLAIAGRLGGAVARNRIKRRVREYFRLHRGRMVEGLDLVVVVHRDLSEVTAETLRAVMGDLFNRAGLFREPSR